MKKNKYVLEISKISIFAILLCVIGIIFMIKAVINQYNSYRIQASYQEADIHKGNYINCTITKEELMGNYYTHNNGKVVYSPVCGTDVITQKQRYLVKVNENYYVSLVIPKIYQETIIQLCNDEIPTYSIYGKFNSLSSELYYEVISKCLGINDRAKIDDMVSSKYEIEIMDPNEEKKSFYKAFIFFLLGLIILWTCIEKKVIEIEK